MTSPEAYIQYTSKRFGPDGEVIDDKTREFLVAFLEAFLEHLSKVLTVLPRSL